MTGLDNEFLRHKLKLTYRDLYIALHMRAGFTNLTPSNFAKVQSITWMGKGDRKTYFVEMDFAPIASPYTEKRKDYYWEGRAFNVADARAKAWNAWLDAFIDETQTQSEQATP